VSLDESVTLDESVKIRVCQIKFPMELAWNFFPSLQFTSLGSKSEKTLDESHALDEGHTFIHCLLFWGTLAV
jgi:hypothetical protein